MAAALAGRYRFERLLGQGGMAAVYLAVDLKHGRPVAFKILRAELSAALGGDRFRREVEIAARLQHPNILTVFDSGETDGTLWYTMPFVDGESLRDRLERERELPIAAALDLIGQVAAALDYAHAAGVVHRDIKPENILLAGDRALVTDFGIARALAVESERLTATGFSLGTPAYMSPEQAAGDRDIDGRSDVYSLASVAFEALAGEPPYTGNTARAVMVKRLTDPVPSARRLRQSIPTAVDRVIQRALSPTPADRFATAGNFARALREGAAAIEEPPRHNAGRRLAIVSLAAAASAILVLLALRAWPSRPAADPRLVRANALLAKRTPAAIRQALSEYEAVHRAEPNNPTALARIGYVYGLFEDWGWPYENLSPAGLQARAMDYSERALAADSSSAEAWLTRGYVLALGDPYRLKGAVAAFSRGLALDSTSAEGWYQLGQALMTLGRNDSAAAAYRRAFRLDPDRPFSLMSLAAMSLQAGHLDEARRIVDSAIVASRTVTSPYARVVRGLIELAGGDVRSARNDGELALAVDSGYTIPTRSLLTRVFVAEKDPVRAAAQLDTALRELGPGTPSPTNARFIASALLAVGRREDAITLFERTRPRGAYLWFYLHGPEFQPLHADPRFERIYQEADPNR